MNRDNPADPSTNACVGAFLAMASLIGGTWTAAVYICGIGIGDTWLFYPFGVEPLLWAILPLGLLAFAIGWFARGFARKTRFTLRDALVALAVLCIVLAIASPFW